MSTHIPSKQSIIYFEENGGIDKLKYSEEWPTPIDQIGSNDVIIKNRYAGINFIEVYFRKGIYPSEKPYLPGREASGEVVAVGSGIDESKFKVGDKVAYLSPRTFAQYTKVDTTTTKILNIGSEASDEELKLYAASLLQGLTALTFIHEAYEVKMDDFIYVTAAAGGVGLILNQLLGKIVGAHVIAVASSDEKLQLAKDNGAEYLLNSSKLSYDEIRDEVLKITNGEGVAAAFDSIGNDTFESTLAIIKRKGTFVSYGNASGPVPPLSINRLSPKNIKLLRPQLYGYISGAEEFELYTKKLFELIKSGQLNIKIHNVYPLKDYPKATSDLEARTTTGKLVLAIP